MILNWIKDNKRVFGKTVLIFLVGNGLIQPFIWFYPYSITPEWGRWILSAGFFFIVIILNASMIKNKDFF